MPVVRSAPTALVLGGSGFLGAHIVRQLSGEGDALRVFARPTSDMRVIAGLPVDLVHGDVLQPDSLVRAMEGIDTVYHCVVDARAWLRDPTPLYRVNVDGLRNSLRAAEAASVRRFVFTSSVGTIAPRDDGGPSNEDDYYDTLDALPPYLRCRVEAERLFLEFVADSRMEGVAACVATTFGAKDLLPTPQGQLILDASRGRMPFYWEGGSCSVGIEDAARGMILAARHGDSGARYIFSERWLSYREMFEHAAGWAGRPGPRLRFPMAPMLAMADVSGWLAARLGRETRFCRDAIRCSTQLSNCRNDRAQRELGWEPAPVEEAIDAALQDFHVHLKG
jgi:dihydroflavonol-4-reductase